MKRDYRFGFISLGLFLPGSLAWLAGLVPNAGIVVLKAIPDDKAKLITDAVKGLRAALSAVGRDDVAQAIVFTERV